MLFLKDYINLGLFHKKKDSKSESESEEEMEDYYYYDWGKKPKQEYYKYDEFTHTTTIRLKTVLKMFREWCKFNGFKRIAEEKSCKGFSNKLFSLKLPIVKSKTNSNQTTIVFRPDEILINLYNKKIVDLDTTLDWYKIDKEEQKRKDLINGSEEISAVDLDQLMYSFTD